jgi:hypothetical protein
MSLFDNIGEQGGLEATSQGLSSHTLLGRDRWLIAWQFLQIRANFFIANASGAYKCKKPLWKASYPHLVGGTTTYFFSLTYHRDRNLMNLINEARY